MALVSRAATLALALLLVGLVRPAWSGEPTDQLRGTIDHVLAILDDPGLKAPGKAPARDAALRGVLEPRVDVARAAREALGLYWRARTPQERQRFTDLFRELLERSYFARLEAYDGARVQYLGESVDGDYATVRTQIVTRRGTDIPVDYQLVRRDGQWLVYDMLIEHVSLVDNYRSQFRDIIATSSYPRLLERIEAKLAELRAGGPSSAARRATTRRS